MKPKFLVGDFVRISKEKGKFGKGYLPNFTEEIFVISKIIYSNVIAYRIIDLDGNEIKGIFYNSELVKVSRSQLPEKYKRKK